MNNYFGNLISRHATPDSGGSSLDVVSPRPKYKFEGEAVSASDIDSESRVISPQNNFSSEIASVNQDYESNTYKGDIVEGTAICFSEIMTKPDSEGTDLRNENINFTHLKVEPANAKNISHEKQSIDSITQSSQGIDKNLEKTSDRFSDSAKQVNLQQNLILQEQIDSILQRMGREAAPAVFSEENNASAFKNESVIYENPSQNAFEEPVEILNEHSSLTSSASKQSKEVLSVEQKNATAAVSEGVLNPPDWLSDMQASINKQMQKFNQQANTPDPVVNVTIGRVEVRAIQSNIAKKQNRQKKPNGVMSLDEYLQQRKSRGQA